MFQVIQEVA